MVKKSTKNFLWIAAIVMGVLVFTGAFKDFNLKLGTLSIGGEAATPAAGTTTTTTEATGKQLSTDSLILLATNKYADTPVRGGDILVFPEGTDPSDPTATAIATIDIDIAYTTGNILSNKKYSVAYDNGTLAYAHEFGDIVLINSDEYNENTADSVVDLTKKFGWKRNAVATLDDMLTETNVGGLINGQTNTSYLNAGEITCGTGAGNCGNGDTLTINDTNSDGSVYVDLLLSAAGSQAELFKPVVCFEFNTTNPPEGNEISAFTVQRQSGADLAIPSSTNWVEVWANEECVSLNNGIMGSGTSGTYRFTMTVAEANSQNDYWLFVFDDLADNRGKDARLNLGAGRNIVVMGMVD